MSERYFRVQPNDRDPTDLLDPEKQASEPWSGTVFGRCDKCEGSGETLHECESCRANGADRDCPACRGEVRYRGECPACGGTGEIDESSRDGVSVFPDEDGLYCYLVKRDADLEDCVLVELEGTPSKDEDFDADQGACLVHPTRVVDVRDVDRGRIEALRRELSAT